MHDVFCQHNRKRHKEAFRCTALTIWNLLSKIVVDSESVALLNLGQRLIISLRLSFIISDH